MTGGGKDEGMETRKDSSLNWGGRDSSEGSFIYIFLFVCFVHNLLTVYHRANDSSLIPIEIS
ncbi:hypothetical protein BYT27DRAFT_6513197 [Phlegmacium glaucopus]|nr:hypothetical protein BYT27DRAFT_6513197 [Phlegmacium glaucopus]